MKHFANLFIRLDQTTKTNVKVDALVEYFQQAEDQDKLWAVAMLSHRRPKRAVNSNYLREWASGYAGIPQWLFEESHHVVGDLAETMSLVMPDHKTREEHSLTDWINYTRQLKEMEEEERKAAVIKAWEQLGRIERFLFNKLITGSFRVGVSQKLMVRALAKYSGIEENKLAHRLMGNWTPDTTSFEKLVYEEDPLDDVSRPYPFYLAYPLEEDPNTLGAPAEWQAERKWDGIRGQIIVRKGEVFVWSRGEELVTDKFPEFHPLAQLLPNGAVIDGEIMPWKDGEPLPFKKLQTRIGRKNVTKSTMKNAPIVMIAYDLLEYRGQDYREQPLEERRARLKALLEEYDASGILLLSETVSFNSWEELEAERANARKHHSEGIMLKRRNSVYKAGRRRGDWWKWKVDPLSIDAVMIYAQRGHGRRANLFTDFTFAVWDGEELVPFTKAYSGLSDKEFREISSWVRRNTIERFGPVRSVKPVYVFEIHFEGIQWSNRHKSGVALRFPRIHRWRKDKPVEEANTLADLHRMLEVYQNPG